MTSGLKRSPNITATHSRYHPGAATSEEGAVENPAVRVILHLPEAENAAHHGLGTRDKVPRDQITCDARIGVSCKLEKEYAGQDVQCSRFHAFHPQALAKEVQDIRIDQ